ncbi:hypothetical protein SAMN05660350_01951 [Geodermatophilus obscurus]|uniref:Uncharacterized protein n=1 Tax=Geodermatophilus obscurus TaxID=1861 RepID=A0A1M7TM10_9ACTN|nr:hypothetical protein [Geodermatophilus obscurus]SHN71764.1 hypothetical protein SAMN05660350_01951 [Geodermatophilus obscurus]
MTTPADVRTDEEAFAACLAGRAVPAGAQGLAAFTDAVRASATEPGQPSAALAELLATGLLVPTQDPSPGTAGRPARTSRKRPHVLISTLVAKFAAAGAVAKAAAAGGVVAVALTGAATTGALTTSEEPASVIRSGDTTDPTDESTDTTTIDGSGDVTGGPAVEEPAVEEPAVQQPAAEEPGVTEPVAEPVAEEPAPAFPEDAAGGKPTDEEKFDRHPANPGRAVSAEAHRRNAERKAGPAVQPEAGAPEGGGTDEVLEAEQAPVTEEPAPAGNGKGNGNGKNGK